MTNYLDFTKTIIIFALMASESEPILTQGIIVIKIDLESTEVFSSLMPERKCLLPIGMKFLLTKKIIFTYCYECLSLTPICSFDLV